MGLFKNFSPDTKTLCSKTSQAACFMELILEALSRFFRSESEWIVVIGSPCSINADLNERFIL